MKFKTVRVIDPVSLHTEVGGKIRAAREAAGWSQAQLGTRLGVTRAGIANIEAGRHAILLVHIYNAALSLDVPVSHLFPKVER